MVLNYNRTKFPNLLLDNNKEDIIFEISNNNDMKKVNQ